MTKEELKQEASEWLRSTDNHLNEGKTHFLSESEYAERAYLAGAEPREKRIEEKNDLLAKAVEQIRSLYYIIQGRIDYEGNTQIGDEMYRAEKLIKEIKNDNPKEQMQYSTSPSCTKATELLNEFMRISKASDEDFEHDYSELIAKAEAFLKEVDK